MHKTKSKLKLFGTIQTMTLSAVFVAISIVCGKYLAINAGPFLRFSFENLPIILSGIMFGPVIGAVVGGTADLIGAMIVYGGDMNIIVTLGAISIGLISGLMWKLLSKLPNAVRLLLATFVAHIIGSVIIKSLGLSAYYFAQYNAPVYIVMLWRALNYVIVGSAEYLLLFFITRNKFFKSKFL